MSQFARLQLNHHKTFQQPVVENQIGKKFVILQQDTFLPGHKSKTLPQFEQEVLQMSDDSRLQIFFIIGCLRLQSQKLQIHGVFDNLLRRLRHALLSRHSQHRLLVVAQQQPFVQLGVYLPLQLPGRPRIVHGLQFVILPFIGFRYSHQHFILRPIQLRPQCGRNWIQPIKLPASLQLSHRKSATIIGFQLLGQVLYQVTAIVGPLFSLLLLLKNAASQLPIHLNPAEIHTTHRMSTSRIDNAADVVQKQFFLFHISIHGIYLSDLYIQI